jgi:mannose-1-phosphate guanylyltransferase
MVLLPMPEGATYAAVETDAGGAVRRIAGRFGPGGDGLSPWHFSGVHVLSPEILARIPAEPFECDINRHVYPPLMASGLVRGRVVRGYWNDLGTPERYVEANGDVLGGRVPLGRFRGIEPFAGAEEREGRVFVAPGASVDQAAHVVGPAFVGARAVVEAEAEIGPGAVVGPGARIRGGAIVRRAVIWEGTTVGAGERVEGGVRAGEDRVGRAG